MVGWRSSPVSSGGNRAEERLRKKSGIAWVVTARNHRGLDADFGPRRDGDVIRGEQDVHDTSVGKRRSGADPDRHRQRWILDRCVQRFQGIAIQHGRRVDLEHR